jgi:hypothetical protein
LDQRRRRFGLCRRQSMRQWCLQHGLFHSEYVLRDWHGQSEQRLPVLPTRDCHIELDPSRGWQRLRRRQRVRERRLQQRVLDCGKLLRQRRDEEWERVPELPGDDLDVDLDERC